MCAKRILITDIVFCILTFVMASDAEQQSVSLNTWVRFSAGYVRCFCNLPLCVTTGYMCKSKEGGCFSDLHEHTSPVPSSGYRGRHGCIELLPDGEQKSRCQQSNEEASVNSAHKKIHPRSLLVCCHHDMCNHVDNPQTRTLLNSTLLSDINEGRQRMMEMNGSQQENVGYTNSEVWFKAATIAVPICGAVILFVLIALAVRILRNEHQNSSNRKLGSMCVAHNKFAQEKYEHLDRILRNPQHSQQNSSYYLNHTDDVHRQIQVPLLVQNEINTHHCGNKNETNAKLNLMQCESVNEFLESGKSLMLEIEKNVSPKCSEVNLDNNVNEKYAEDKYKNEDKVFPDGHM